MRRTPDKDTILKLRAQGLNLTQIGKRYGVCRESIRWALRHVPKAPPPLQACHVPSHVIDHWRNEWGWSEKKIYQTCRQFEQSLIRR